MMMLHYQTIAPKNHQLKPYIEAYITLRDNGLRMKSKDFIPRPSAIWAFTNESIQGRENNLPKNLVIGIQTTPLFLQWNGGGYGFFVKFTSYGLSRFVSNSVCQFTDQSIDGAQVWGEEAKILHSEIIEASSTEQQIELVERFLLSKYIGPSPIEKSIFQLVDKLNSEHAIISLKELKEQVPLSTRHLERKFKELIGVNIQTFHRICRFDQALEKLRKSGQENLTQIGYESGYFDQAHFSREFKTFTKLPPKDFFDYSPFYQLILQEARGIIQHRDTEARR